MDPNQALVQIRALCARLSPMRRDYNQDTGNLIAYVTTLDDWLTRGGFPPDAWDHSGCTGDCSTTLARALLRATSGEEQDAEHYRALRLAGDVLGLGE